ncbi:MAG: hypothetical protein N2259_01580 [Patescibacteria group bacterium]|nr:hypothetical protein [Patescibacteria group bacterium]
MKVFEGEVDFKSKATGETIKVKGGEKAEANSNKLSQAGSLDVGEEIESWLSLRNAENINWEGSDEKEVGITPSAPESGIKTESKFLKKLPIIAVIIVIIIAGIIIAWLRLVKKRENRF